MHVHSDELNFTLYMNSISLYIYSHELNFDDAWRESRRMWLQNNTEDNLDELEEIGTSYKKIPTKKNRTILRTTSTN
jgi:hypothetical protein